MKRRYLSVAAFAIAALALPKGDVEACGPFYEPEVFVRAASADNRAAFAAGELGILSGYQDSSDLAVAYRYLNGGRLSEAERNTYAPHVLHPSYDDNWWMTATLEQRKAAQAEMREQEKQARDTQPANVYLNARAEYGPLVANVQPQRDMRTDSQGNVVLDWDYVNCPGAAFKTATLTLANRAQQWGKESKWLADWIRGQDAVFSNCAGTAVIPIPAHDDAPALLKADRAYQTAAAAFYASKFDEAAQQFATIASDESSPWHEWGKYLEARALIRKAFGMGKASDPYSGEMASFDADTMRRAQQMLESLLAQPHPEPSREIVQRELNVVLIRTDPEKRAADLSAALAGPEPDANFGQDLQDLNFFLVKHINVKGPAPLFDWIKAWRGGTKAADAYATWQQTHALPWLVTAADLAGPKNPFVPALLADASKIAPRTPAYDTVFYHRVRLLIVLNRTDEARTLLDAALPALRNQKMSSKLNALLGQRMKVARSFNEFLVFAPRQTLSTGSPGYLDLRGQCNERAHAINDDAPCPEAELPLEFEGDAAQILNRKVPLNMLIEAAGSSTLPQHLRENIAIMAWTRAVLLQDSQSAAAIAPKLPKSLRDTAGTGVGFAANLSILRNPGIRPYLEAGVPRVSSYRFFDGFRNNWWCKPWSEVEGEVPSPVQPIPNPVFLPADRVDLAESQYEQLQKLPSSAAVIGQRVLDYAKSHTDDPQVPEALALTVRATHYACQTYDYSAGGNPTSEYTPTSKAAFELLHRQYPKSPWTAKTRYYY